MKQLRERLQQRKHDGLYRQHRIAESPQAVEMQIDGKQVINFCSNNYLGLANHPDVKQAFIQGIEKWGAGSGSAHLINGHSAAHQALEDELADFLGYPRCLLFSTGYMANLAIAQTLVSHGDLVLEDRLNHASLIDAGLLSGATFKRYKHRDYKQASSYLTTDAKQKLLMTDGVFSMDGELAPLPELQQACQDTDTTLMVDDAHGIGVLGEHGRGCIEHFELSQPVDVLMGTLGKAFGTAGAFVAGSDEMIESLIQFARPYIYTTASPAALAEASRASLMILRTESWRREALSERVQQFRQGAQQLGLELLDSMTPIQPVIIGDNDKVNRLSQQLFKAGFHISAIRPPTVPKNTARLRITLCADHTPEHVDKLLNSLGKCLQS